MTGKRAQNTMTTGALILIIGLIVPASPSAQTLGRSQGERFTQSLLENGKSMDSWFDRGTLEASRRLGIEYDGVENKYLISYGFGDSVRQMVEQDHIPYSVSVDTLGGGYARLVVTIGKLKVSRSFYFRGDRCISPLAYFARHWTVINSKHFRFFISDTTLFNSCCITRLESYLRRMSRILDLGKQEMTTLKEKKIYYYMCRNEDEIKQLTGYRARGMYNLAYDAVVTTFNAHYHELTHLLVNYKLHRLPLYANHFLQEGFAVAYGGRGGLSAEALLHVGAFLYRSRFVALSQLLSNHGFESTNASISYPAAGLYNKFLVGKIGIDHYLQLYRSHTGPAEDGSVTDLPLSELPPDSAWDSYLHKILGTNPIVFPTSGGAGRVIMHDGTCTITADGKYYYFSLTGSYLVRGNGNFPNYVSSKFKEFFPHDAYRGQEYLIRATRNEVAVYNLYTNDLLADYVSGFSATHREVPFHDGRYIFAILKSVFDKPIVPHR